MHFNLLLVALGATLSSAAPLARDVPPTVQITGGTIIGTTDLTVETFNGIPFAEPPVGDLRLRAPQPLKRSLGTFAAVGIPKSCPQQLPIDLDVLNLPTDVIAPLEGNPIVTAATDTSEDCLTLNVQRPAGVSTNTSLPVLVYIYGGGFELGSTQMYNGGNIVKTSVALGKPFVYVEMNYRVAGWGFLAGKELQAEGNTNLGLRDQRLALQWVQDNIVAFGGDPTKVTIWGESAGAISTFDHTIIKGGDNSYKNGKLFRGAIMNSGSIVPTLDVASNKAQNVYDTVVDQAGCKGSQDTLACLRSVDYATFSAAVNYLPGILSYRSLDLAYLPRPDPADNFFPVSPEIAVANGHFTKVPVIIGDNEDEGTLFSILQANVTTTDLMVDYLETFFPDQPNIPALVTGLVQTYPDDPSAGSPFRTGAANELRPQYKRLAAILGDFAFTLTRRSYLYGIVSKVPAWTYLNSFAYGTPILGTAHGLDIPVFMGDIPGVPSASVMRYYTSFINNLDPNALGNDVSLINWPQWSGAGRAMLQYNAAGNTLITDTFREAQFQYLNSIVGKLRI